MNVICNADGYSVRKNATSYVVSSEVLASNSLLLFFASFCEMFLPDPTTYRAPISVIIKDDDSMGEVTVDKNLKVTGTNDYEYVIINSQLRKWFHSYFIMWVVTLLLVAILAVFIFLEIFPEMSNPISILCFFVVLGILIVDCVRMGKQIVKIRTLRHID